MSLVVKTTPVRIYGLGQPIYEPTESDISKDSEKSECPQSDMEKKCLKESERTEFQNPINSKFTEHLIPLEANVSPDKSSSKNSLKDQLTPDISQYPCPGPGCSQKVNSKRSTPFTLEPSASYSGSTNVSKETPPKKPSPLPPIDPAVELICKNWR